MAPCLEAGPSLLRRTAMAGAIVGVGFVVIADRSYHISLPLLLVVFASTVGGGAMAVAGAQFQSEQRFGISLALTQSPNLTLMVAALVVVVTGIEEAQLPLAISALGLVLAGVIGWWVLFRERAAKPYRETWFPWGEALSFAGLNAAGLVLIQLDRLIIPQVLPLHDLATYGVLAAIAGSLFRVLQMAAAYTLTPRLRAAAIERHFLAGKYHLGGSLLFAALFSGVAKVMNAFTKSTVTALATAGELSIVNLFGWVSVAVAVVAAIIGARWGLTGLVYGVGLGWLMRALTALYLTLRHLKLPESIPNIPSQSSWWP